LPAREFASDSESISIFKKNYLSEFGNIDGFIYKEVSEGRFPGGIEFYLPLFFHETNTLLDYLNTQAIIVYQKGFIEAAQLHNDELLDRFEHCKLSLQRLPLSINKVFLNAEELFKLLQDKKKIQTQASKSNKKESLNFTTALLPPLKIQSQTKNPLKKLIKFVENFEGRVLIVCESQGRQSVLTDLLSSYQLSAVNCDIGLTFLNKKKSFVLPMPV